MDEHNSIKCLFQQKHDQNNYNQVLSFLVEQDIIEVVSKFIIAVMCLVYGSVVHQINLINKFIIIIVLPRTTNENKLGANE